MNASWEIMNYIQNNYADVTMDVLAEKFGLSKPYLSKYIKEKSGMTFQDAVKAARMKKARRLLKSQIRRWSRLQRVWDMRTWSILTACSKRRMR